MEDKSGAFDTLARRRKMINSLQSHRQRQSSTNKRLFSRKSVDVIENSETESETPTKRPRKEPVTQVKRPRKQPETPVKYPSKQVETPVKCLKKQPETPAKRPVKCPRKQPETLNKCYTDTVLPKTPIKTTRYQNEVTPNKNIDNSIISTSTFSLPYFHDFFVVNTPSKSPFKICENEAARSETSQAVATSQCTLSALAINIKDTLDPLSQSGFETAGEVTTTMTSTRIPSAPAAGPQDTHPLLPETATVGVEAASTHTLSAPAAGAEDTHRLLPEPRPATISVAAASIHPSSAPAAGADDTHLLLPQPRPATVGVAAASIHPSSVPAAGAEDTHRLLPEPRPATIGVAAASIHPSSSPAAGADDTHLLLPEPRPATVGVAAASIHPSSVPAVDAEDTHRLLPETRPATVGVAAVSIHPSSAPTAGAEDTHRLLPETRPVTVGVAAASIHPSSASTAGAEDTHHLLPEKKPATVVIAAASIHPSSAPAAGAEETPHSPLPETGPETDSVVVACTQPLSAPTAGGEDTPHSPLPETGQETDHIRINTPSAFALATTRDTENIYHPLSNTEQATSDVEMTNLYTAETLSIDVEHTSLTKSQKRRKRRNATKIFKKSCMDFQSDEDFQDFSAGSSDVWSCSDDSDSSQSSNDKKKNKKKSKNKQKATTDDKIKKRENKINTKNINKKRKDSGEEYTTRKGKVVEAKTMLENPCIAGKCKRGCYEISEERRRSLFTFFWKLDVQRRRDWLVRCAREIPIKRKRTDSNRRNCSYEYFINNGDDHKKVCQKFVLNTLNITQRQFLYILSNAQEGMSQKEMRKPHCSNKFSETAKEYVRNFIEKLPACPSHYNRKKSKRMYLAQELKDLSNLFRIYLKDCKEHRTEAVSESIFRNIFNNEYDLGFHTPKKDKCVLCTKSENIGNEMTENDKENLKIHMEEKNATYKRFKAHQTLKDVETVTCSFDLQKVLNTPFGESMLLYYSRKYAVYNFTIYESVTQNVFCFTWGECDGKRGSVETASCLYLYLQELDKAGVKNVLMYCDSCTGQNKNRIVLSVLNFFLHRSDNVQVIQINYLLPGHTYMPADSVHATIEAEVNKIIVWAPSQWPSYFESARKKPKPYNVTVMEHSDFIDWEQLAVKTFTKDTAKNIKFKEIRVATFKKKNLNLMEIKYSMKTEAVTEKVTLFEKPSKKGKGKGKWKGKGRKKVDIDVASQTQEIEYLQDLNDFNMRPKYIEKLPISTLKYRDLQKLCSAVTIPKRFHREYLEMPYDGQKNDTLIETDEEDNDNKDEEEDPIVS